MFGIITYNRPKELLRLTKELSSVPYMVIDDGSDYKSFISNDKFVKLQHRGKKGFWLTYSVMMAALLNSKYDDFVILPDDVHSLDLERIAEYHARYKNEYYTVNLINDNRKACWVVPRRHKVEEDMINKGFFDCGGLTNRKTLQQIKLQAMPNYWWKDENRSSGVGFQITRQLQPIAKMFTPKISLAYHGNHESKMHPNERLKTPLISL